MEEDATQPVMARQDNEGLQSSLEIHIRDQEEGVKVYPLHRKVLEWESSSGQKLRFTYQGGEVLFRNLTLSEPLYKDGQAVSSGRMEVGGFLESADLRIRLWDSGRPSAYLKGYSAPYSGEIWPVTEGTHPLGRPGQRANAIQLDHPTVSRKHATITMQDGQVRLLAESATNPVCVGGQTVEPGEVVHLVDGDLIEVGDLVFRFQWPGSEPSPPETSLIRVRSLGSFQAFVGSEPISDKEWKTQHIKWLFAHLAYAWGRPLAIEQLLEELWPDFTTDRSKNNLNYSLSTLRQTLRSHLPEAMRKVEIVLRSSSTLQLNSDLLDSHDVVLLQRDLQHVSQAKDESWESAAERAVLAYAGPFLSDCYLDWVSPLRQSLEIEVLDVAKRLLDHRFSAERWEAMIAVAGHVLKIDPCAQWACLRLMQALRHCQRATEAVRVFEQCRKTLHKELEVEPDLDLLTEHQRALSALA